MVATYPGDARDILVSGYLKGGERLENKAAVVEYGVGKGRIVLIGFRPQHRAQPHPQLEPRLPRRPPPLLPACP